MAARKSKRRRYFAPIDHESFKQVRLAARLSIESAAAFLQVTSRTLRYWESGRVRIPYAAFRLLRIHASGAVQAVGWDGWHFGRDGTLWSPEGHAFCGREMAYWWLLVAQARAFRETRDAQASRVPRVKSRPGEACPVCRSEA